MCTSNCHPGYYEYNKAMSPETDGYEDPAHLLNDTDSELSDLAHLDAPNDSLYMIGGVCVAMFMVGVIIVLLAVTISKLRKREEHSNSVHPVADVVLQTAPQHNNQNNHLSNNHQVSVLHSDLTYRGQFLWTQPPTPAQQYLYNHNQDTLVQNIQTERPSLVRGFRKNLGGKWRRLVKRKPTPEVYTIPPELKPQLKQIYVY